MTIAKHELPSLFVVSLPRSLSSTIYEVSRRALGLVAPAWTTDGELLNPERFLFSGTVAGDHNLYLCDPAQRAWGGAWAFLDTVVQPTGFAYKDVLQPLLLTRWLADDERFRRFRILRLRRSLADVAFAMLRLGWTYPRHMSGLTGSRPAAERVMAGLLRAREVLDTLPAVELDYEAFVRSEAALEAALRRLYPTTELSEIRYIDADFEARRDQVMARRRDPEWQMLDALARQGEGG